MYRTLIVLLGVSLVLAVADLLTLILSMVLLIFAGILFGILINGVSAWLVRWTGSPYRVAYVLVVALLAATLLGGGYLMGTRVVDQTAQLSDQLQQATEQLKENLQQYPWAPQFEDFRSSLAKLLGNTNSVTQGVQWVAGMLTSAVVILFVGLYVAYDPNLYEVGATKLVPIHRRDKAREVMSQARSALAHWIIGRLISMSIIGIITAIGLSVMGVPLAITLGVLAALLTFIPNIGPVMAMLPQMLVALQVDMYTPVYVLIFNIVLQGIESYLITPVVNRYEVTLPPALTISTQLLLGAVAGITGLMMAAPLTALAMVCIQLLYIRDKLGDPSPGELATR